MADGDHQRAQQIARNFLESRIGALEAARALLPLLNADPKLATAEDKQDLIEIDRETNDLPVGRIREECHPDVLLEKDKQIERYEKLYRDQVRFICERILQGELNV